MSTFSVGQIVFVFINYDDWADREGRIPPPALTIGKISKINVFDGSGQLEHLVEILGGTSICCDEDNIRHYHEKWLNKSFEEL